jgi:hypothetical protein
MHNVSILIFAGAKLQFISKPQLACDWLQKSKLE